MNFDLNQNNLLKYLNELKLKPILQKQTNQIYIEMKILNSDVPVFFDIRSENAFLHTIAYLPYQLQKKTLHEAARMLHHLNRELDMPGFGMDEQEKLMFYRCMIPCLNKKIDEQLLNVYLSTTRVACETFMQGISSIVTGGLTVDEMFSKKPKSSSS